MIWIPQFWWHATMNIDNGTTAYGEKPSPRWAVSVVPSGSNAQDDEARSRIRSAFAQQTKGRRLEREDEERRLLREEAAMRAFQQLGPKAFDVMSFLNSTAPALADNASWYNLASRWRAVLHRAASCNRTGRARRARPEPSASLLFEPVDATLRKMASASGHGNKLLRDASSLAHCVMAEALERQFSKLSPAFHATTQASLWRTTACDLSPAVCGRQCVWN